MSECIDAKKLFELCHGATMAAIERIRYGLSPEAPVCCRINAVVIVAAEVLASVIAVIPSQKEAILENFGFALEKELSAHQKDQQREAATGTSN